MNENMKETWRPITQYENTHEVSNLGRIRKIKNGRIYHLCKNNIGYVVVGLRVDGLPAKHYKVHRLVAKAFCPNDLNYPDINHKDGNKENNCADNLEWCTASQNTKHAHRIGLFSNKKYIRDLFGRFTKITCDNPEASCQ